MSAQTTNDNNRIGLIAALLTPLFLGMNPIFGKLALRYGADPFTVAALRTVVAVGLLWLVYYLFWRHYLFIYPAGLMNCVAIGFVNGIGSLMYYNGLNLLDASIAQLINGMYLVFVLILTRISGQKIGPRTIFRVMVAVLGVLFITGQIGGQAQWAGIGFMLGNALLFAGTVVMSQRALYDMPAQTVAFYVLATMAVVVAMARVAYDLPLFVQESAGATSGAMWAILGLATTTALSRLLMFVGVKGLGSLQTTLLAILEIAASITLAYLLLDETLSTIQWAGVAILAFSLLMPMERLTPPDTSPTSYVPLVVRVRIMQAAFDQAFIADQQRKYTTQELSKIRELYSSDKYTTMDLIALEQIFSDDPTEPVAPDIASQLEQTNEQQH
ncbi:MAG: DMT family transporter [Chloroflexi bacterium]|nr:DMT family transporter [Chloroflexota bacterium]